ERERLLHKAVLSGVQNAPGKLRMRRHRGGDRHRIEFRITEKIFHVSGEPCASKHGLEAGAGRVAAVAAPDELASGERIEITGEIRTPIAESDDSYLHT